MEKAFLVSYEVRTIGAIGIFWNKEDTIVADSPEQARERFRARWQHKYEFRSPIKTQTYNPE